MAAPPHTHTLEREDSGKEGDDHMNMGVETGRSGQPRNTARLREPRGSGGQGGVGQSPAPAEREPQASPHALLPLLHEGKD